MISTFLLLATTSQPVAKPPLEEMVGCWSANGHVLTKPVENIVRVTKRLEGKYYLLELHGLNKNDPYDAAIVYAQKQDGSLTSYWMDTFGGDGSTTGSGVVSPNGMSVSYQYSDGEYLNVFSRTTTGWSWVITETDSAKKTAVFANYELSRKPCLKSKFKF